MKRLMEAHQIEALQLENYWYINIVLALSFTSE